MMQTSTPKVYVAVKDDLTPYGTLMSGEISLEDGKKFAIDNLWLYDR